MNKLYFRSGTLGLAAAFAIATLALEAQRGGAASGAGNSGAGNAGIATPGRTTGPTTTNPNYPNNPNYPTNTYPTQPGISRPIFLSGKVMLNDGTPPPEPVVMELVCGGYRRPQGYTDSKGRFSFQIGQNADVAADASYSSTPGLGPSGTGRNQMNSIGGDPSGNVRSRDLMGCEVRAVLAGFRSDSVNLAARRSLDDPDVGTIILHRLANVEGLTISITSALAPKDAKKAFEKAQILERQQKWGEAGKEFRKAVGIYPKYAVAWYQLGLLQEQQKDPEAARKCYTEALAADSKFVSPYQALAVLSSQEQKWQDVVENTEHLLRLNPVDFPQAWLFNAYGNFYQKNMDAAEKSAREGLSRDTAHRYPDLNHVLGVVLAMKRDYAGAVDQLRDYLHYAPNAVDTEEVKRQLAEVERVMGTRAKKEDPAAAKTQ